MPKLLVTGGAGFIGSNFIHYWLREHPDDEIVNLDLLTYAGNLGNLAAIESHSGYRFVRGDIRDRHLVDTLFSQENFDTVVNFAAESHVDRSITGPEAFLDTNVMGTFVLLEAAKKVWPNTAEKRFLHVSTDEVFGSLDASGQPFTETTPYAPNSPYAASKAASDHLVRAYHHTYDLPVLTTNCSNNYGPYQFPEKLIPLVFVNALEGRSLPIYGDGSNVRDWLYVEDHCRGIDAVLQKGRPGRTYNIGGCNEWRNLDIVQMICDYLDERIPAQRPRRELIEFVKDRPGHDQRYAIDASAMKRDFGWQPTVTFEQGIRRTLDWYLANPEWLTQVRDGAYRDFYDRQYAGRLAPRT
ncbi:MAG: dTDP-glucose 4,6-dehydratase [Thiogranum sp.]|nr:dTDP-glucose 4,6-dehydratase [Thiogranum sp.]